MLLSLLWMFVPSVNAQQPRPTPRPVPQPLNQQRPPGQNRGQPMESGFWRIGVLELMSPRFNDPHPFKSMTGSNQFDNPRSSAASTVDYLETIKEPPSVSFTQRILHNIPPISIDYLYPYDFWIKAVSFGYYHTTSYEEDTLIRGTAEGARSLSPLIRMKTYYDLAYFLVHPFFDPTNPGVDFHLGLGIGSIEGYYMGGYRGRIENGFRRITAIKKFNALPITFKEIGLDTNGEVFGARFSLFMLNKETVISGDENLFLDNPFGLAPKAGKNTSFSGILMRVALTIKL